MAKKSDTTATPEQIEFAARSWFDANAAKNKAASKEKKERDFLEKNLVDKGLTTVVISESMDLEIGWENVPDEEVDVQKLFKENPNLFWTLCTIPKTALVKELGPKGAAKVMRPITKNQFKFNKIKKAVISE